MERTVFVRRTDGDQSMREEERTARPHANEAPQGRTGNFKGQAGISYVTTGRASNMSCRDVPVPVRLP